MCYPSDSQRQIDEVGSKAAVPAGQNLGEDAPLDSNAYLADRLNVAWEVLRMIAETSLPPELRAEVQCCGVLCDEVLEAARRLRAQPDN
jgi:hypothetical protein